MKTQSLKNTLVFFVVIVITPMIFINAYTLLVGRNIENQYSEMINKMMKIDQINKDINDSVFYFDKYITSNAQSDLNSYISYYNKANVGIISLQSVLESQSMYALIDLKHTLESYKLSAENTIYKFRFQESNNDFYNDFVETKNVASYCSDYIGKLSESYLKYNSISYDILMKKSRIIYGVSLIFFILIILACIIFTIFFSKSITGTLQDLVSSAEHVSKGDFNIKRIKRSDIYEVDILSDGFNSMVLNINQLVRKIKKSAETEKKLKDQEMKNLQIENMLKETQLKVLQSQINPHFLFNTLNTIVQTAMIEEAIETEKLMKSVSELLRYSLKMMDRFASLKEELNIVNHYAYIQETRFKDRVKFKIDINTEIENIIIPGMTLQPLVENAFIHGIEPKEEGGSIQINVSNDGGYCVIAIKDDGCGMSIETLNEILSNDKKEKHIGHTTGIGVRNVIERLRLMYNDERVVSIESRINGGTQVYLRIPIRET